MNNWFKCEWLLIMLCMALGGISIADRAFVEEERGARTFKSIFRNGDIQSDEAWAIAQEKQAEGAWRSAVKRYEEVYTRWPNSLEAPQAVEAHAELLLARKKWQSAFDVYQYGIDNYANRLDDYSGFLHGQYTAAIEIMEHRRMPFLFGGYTSPELAIPLFEKIITNGSQWDRAPEVWMRIADAYEQANDLEEAISAYRALEFGYPTHILAQDALLGHIRSLEKLRNNYPNNVKFIDRLVTATARFITTYPASEKRADLVRLRNRLYEDKAIMKWEEAAFYERVAKNKQAALRSYAQLVESYPKSEIAVKAKERLDQLMPQVESGTSDGER